jgi:signal transduction histidine kinase/ActR/RegA family two-component response regulator
MRYTVSCSGEEKMKDEVVNKKHSDSIFLSASPGFRSMGLNPLTLSFPGDLEETFLEYYFKKYLKQVRFSVSLAVLFFAVFGILDAALVPEMKGSLWFIRYALICPGLLMLLLFSFSRHFKRYMQLSISVLMIWTGFGIVAMIIIAPPPANFSYYAGLILVFMYGYTFVKARFVWATLAGWVIVACYEIAAILLSNTPISVLINNNFFFIGANIIGMFACYSIEYYARRDFFLARLLENEQEKVKAANLELEKRVRERTSQLVRANEDLEQEMSERKRAERELMQSHKMEAIGTLAGGIAHDFNNILTSIIGYSEIGLYSQNMEKEKLKYSFEQILQAGTRAKDLIKQILTFSRQREQERVPIKTGLIVKEALKLLRSTLPKTIEIRENIRTDSDMILADPTQIHQILINLCTNATHAMREKGGVLEVSLDDVYIDPETAEHISDLPAGPYLEIRVQDTGTGMNTSVIERVFDPFFTTKGPSEGTGMGLSVVHGIVKSHGGKITIESTLDMGSTFHVFLPRIEEELKEEPETIKQAPTGSERILFVDDEESVKEYGETMLRMLGYKVVAKTNSIEAFNYFREQPERFDLVITDQIMPNMTGEELTKELLNIRADIPIILCTGFSEFITEEKAKAIGIKELFMKPIVMYEMAETIRRVLDQNN